MTPRKILIVDDEEDIIEMLSYNLQKEGYVTSFARSGESALNMVSEDVDLILLDVMMPGMDGWEVCKRLKRNTRTAHIPVLFLTAKGGEVDEVVGFELGADDFIVKPISIRRLLARIQASLRRLESKNAVNGGVVRIEDIEINISNHSVTVGGCEVPFTRKEFGTLAYLVRHRGRLITRETLLNEVWGKDINVIDRTVDVHISRIREKLGSSGSLIETMKGVGYRIKTTGRPIG